ncbi:MAG TPA: TetR/AcrR family transcriptional regulator [Longimicrobiales bacterium]|nr:TetR/AcrR family transcriptional regulator [Longimicrobiales bacterium]
MGITERKEREFQRRERAILDAALGLCACDEWQSVTVDQIAERAEIGKGTVYKHFASKDEIYARLAMDYKRRNLERLRRIDPQLDVIQRLRAMIAVFWDTALAGAEYQRLVQYVEREDFRLGLPEGLRAEFEELDREFNEVIGAVLEEGMRRHLLPRKRPDQLLFGPMAALTGARQMVWGGCLRCEVPPENFLEELSNFVLAGMLYQEWLAEEGLIDDDAVRRALAAASTGSEAVRG